MSKATVLVTVPIEEWEKMSATIQEIFGYIQQIQQNQTSPRERRIRPQEFMAETGIKRTKFDSLIAENRIKFTKKARKIYIPYSEVDRYWNDPSIF